MALDIKLKLDKKAVDYASKKLSKGSGTGTGRKGGLGIGAAAGAVIGAEEAEGAQGKKGKGKEGSALTGGLIGGFVGAILSALKPIREILEVIGGILQILFTPILRLLRPFLILFLKVGLLLNKFLKGNEKGSLNKDTFTGVGAAAGGGEVEGSIGEWIQNLKTKFAEWVQAIFNPDNAQGLWGILLTVFSGIFVGGLGNLFFGFLDVLGGLLDLIIGLFTGDWKRAAQGIVKVFTGIWDMFVGLVKIVIGFLGAVVSGIAIGIMWIWEGIKILGGFGKWLWDSLVDIFNKSLSVLSGIGNWIWDKIKSFFSGGGGSKSHNDVLITSGGQVHDFSPEDNILAFKDFSTIQGGGGGGQSPINIYVEGFVGDEDALADKVGKALSNRNRGGQANY